MPQNTPPADIKDNNYTVVSSLLGSPFSITCYFITIILLSIFGLFNLFPRFDLNSPSEKLAITALNTQDTIVKIKGNLEPLIVKDKLTDSLTLRLNVARKTFKDTVTRDTVIITSEHSISFPRGAFPNNKILWLIIIVGILGASIHALTSLSEFVGNNTFDKNWSLWYYLRPFVGALLALLSYWFLRAGLFSIESTKDLYGILAVAGLIGIFSKQALYKISDIANAIFTSNHEKHLKGKLSENPIPKVNSIPQEITVGTTNRSIILTGENFVSSTKVYYNKEELPTVIKSSTELEVSLNEKSVLLAGDLALKIVNPPPGGGEVVKTIMVIPLSDISSNVDAALETPSLLPNNNAESTAEETPSND